MQIIQDTETDFPLFVIKNFLPNPEQYRETVLKASVANKNGAWVGDEVIVSDDLKLSTINYIFSCAENILNDYIWSPQPLIAFRKLKEPRASNLIVHTDRFHFFDFATGGRPVFAHWAHWSFIFDFTPQNNSARLKFAKNKKGEPCVFIFKEQFGKEFENKLLDKSEWTFYKEIPYFHNTAIMFPSHYFHTAENFMCSEEMPRTMGATWFYSGYNPLFHKTNISFIDELSDFYLKQQYIKK